VAWIWLSGALGLRLPISPHWLRALLWLAVTPLLLVPVIHALHAPDSGPARIAFTRLMQFGNAIAAVPVGLGLLWALARERPGGQRLGAPGRALIASLVLFACGGVIGALISGVNTVIPAHYHGSIVGVTLALMGLTYHLLPALGFGRPAGRLARWQPGLYGAGQLLHVAGLAISGAMGVQRKTAGSAQMLEGWQAKAAMGVMGIGGLLAVLGGILFVVVVGRCLLARGTPPR
jgi:heme/copper-type cytochrome/quinol oxidase subunit 1